MLLDKSVTNEPCGKRKPVKVKAASRKRERESKRKIGCNGMVSFIILMSTKHASTASYPKLAFYCFFH